jgi:hypothetical protein
VPIVGVPYKIVRPVRFVVASFERRLIGRTETP